MNTLTELTPAVSHLLNFKFVFSNQFKLLLFCCQFFVDSDHL